MNIYFKKNTTFKIRGIHAFDSHNHYHNITTTTFIHCLIDPECTIKHKLILITGVACEENIVVKDVLHIKDI